MVNERRVWMTRTFWLSAVLAGMGACSTTTQSGSEPAATSSSALFTNGGFETGAAGTAPPAPWVVQSFLNPATGFTVQAPETRAGLNLTAGGAGLTTILEGTSQPWIRILGATAPLRLVAVRRPVCDRELPQRLGLRSWQQHQLAQPGDDRGRGRRRPERRAGPRQVRGRPRPAEPPTRPEPAAVILLHPGHGRDAGHDALHGLQRERHAGRPPGREPQHQGRRPRSTTLDWSLVDVSPGAAAALHGRPGQARDHRRRLLPRGPLPGEIYVDGVGPTIPGIFVSGAGTTQANAGANITYTLHAGNGGLVPETGTTVDFTTPPNTTFQSIAAPGLACVTPAAGTAGVVVCTIPGSFAPGAALTLSLTVNVAAGTTGQIVAGNYLIQSPPRKRPRSWETRSRRSLAVRTMRAAGRAPALRRECLGLRGDAVERRPHADRRTPRGPGPQRHVYCGCRCPRLHRRGLRRE